METKVAEERWKEVDKKLTFFMYTVRPVFWVLFFFFFFWGGGCLQGRSWISKKVSAEWFSSHPYSNRSSVLLEDVRSIFFLCNPFSTESNTRYVHPGSYHMSIHGLHLHFGIMN